MCCGHVHWEPETEGAGRWLQSAYKPARPDLGVGLRTFEALQGPGHGQSTVSIWWDNCPGKLVSTVQAQVFLSSSSGGERTATSAPSRAAPATHPETSPPSRTASPGKDTRGRGPSRG